MLSPFPGMDPYLEHPGSWPDVHISMITAIRSQLSRTIRPKYTVRIEERVYISDEDDPGRKLYVPDLHLIQRPRHAGGGASSSVGASMAVAEPLALITVMDEEIRERRLSVIDRATHEVVTIIEVLSPANKMAGARGRRHYKRKRREVFDSDTHLVEIDLLRAGERFVSKEVLPPCEYLVHVSIEQDRPKGLVWPVRLSERLPIVKVPLRAGDPSAPLDLQAALESACEDADYIAGIDYSKPPVPPLSSEWAEWADRLLREKGLRENATPA